jgi:hypothetical protein
MVAQKLFLCSHVLNSSQLQEEETPELQTFDNPPPMPQVAGRKGKKQGKAKNKPKKEQDIDALVKEIEKKSVKVLLCFLYFASSFLLRKDNALFFFSLFEASSAERERREEG